MRRNLTYSWLVSSVISWQGLIDSLPHPVDDERSQMSFLFRADFHFMRSKRSYTLSASLPVPHVEFVVPGKDSQVGLVPRSFAEVSSATSKLLGIVSPPASHFLPFHSIWNCLSRTPAPIADTFPFYQRSKHVVDDPFLLLHSVLSLRS